MDHGVSRRANVFGAVVGLICFGFLASCSDAPKEPAPVFAVPVSQIIGAPKIEGQEPAVSTAQSNTRQLRYIAVPPGQKVAGMARANLILKPAHHHAVHSHKANQVARHAGVQAGSATRSPAKTGDSGAAKPATSE